MRLTKIKRKNLKRGDMFCEVDGWIDRPAMITFKDGDDTVFNPSTRETEVYRIDVPDYTHELTQFSWKLKQLDDMLSATIDKVRVVMRKRGSVVAIQAVNQTIHEHDHSEDDTQCDHVEKLAVDSVSLDNIISVVYGWNRDARGYPDMAMEKIAKIIEERGD